MSSTPTHDHLQRAFDMARRPDWPATLAELLTAARQAALVQGLALRLANGQGMALPHAPAGLADAPATGEPPPVPLRCWDYAPRRAGTSPAAPHHRRRSDGIDLKRAAAGERDDD